MSTYENLVWTLPDGVFVSDAVKQLYSQSADEIRTELEDRGANIFDHLLAERILFAYCHIRDKDAQAGTKAAWAHDRVRRETLKDFFSAAENIQRRWLRSDWADAEETVKRKLAGALNEALLDIDPSVAGHLRDKLSEELAKAGI